MSEIKNYGKSIRARLLNVAKQEKVFYQTILDNVRTSLKSKRKCIRINPYICNKGFFQICTFILWYLIKGLNAFSVNKRNHYCPVKYLCQY